MPVKYLFINKRWKFFILYGYETKMINAVQTINTNA